MERLAQMQDLAQRMNDNEYDPVFLGPPKSREYVMKEIEKWRRVTRELR